MRNARQATGVMAGIMKAQSILPLGLLSIGLALSAPFSRADDTGTPPSPPATALVQQPAGDDAAPALRQRRVRNFMLARLTEKLSLTADEQTAVSAILSNSQAQVQTLRSDDSITLGELRTQLRAIRATARTQIRATLTPDQQKIFDTLPQHEARAKAAPTT
jgi:hypothetical protein